jgi:ankyrin repeat protein
LTGDLTIINQLKKFYAIKHNEGNNYCSPVHCAAINPNPEFLRKLLSIFTDIIDVEDNQQKKPIHYASVYSNTANLMTLVDNGADLRDTDRRKMTALMLACEEGITSNVEYILQTLRDPYYINMKSEEGYCALHYAVLNNA